MMTKILAAIWQSLQVTVNVAQRNLFFTDLPGSFLNLQDRADQLN